MHRFDGNRMEDRYDAVVMHYGEIGVKGKNKGTFINTLYGNVKATLHGEKYESLKNMRDRLLLNLSAESDVDSIVGKLGHVFGLAWYAPAYVEKNNVKDIVKRLVVMSKGLKAVKVVAHRTYKDVDFTSEGIISEFIKSAARNGVNADKDAEYKLFVNVTKDGTIISGKIRGLGGLPVGSSKKAVVLLSGGIDSPVSAFFMMKRGMVPVYLHVHAFPDAKEAAESKIGRIVEVLNQYSNGASRTYYVPGHIFLTYATKERSMYELVLFKRFLYKLAERIAENEGAEAIVTGDSLGQVASQTIENIASSSKGVKTLLLRPLIGLDKNEIIDYAKRIGTYELSILPYRDVCSINSKNQKTVSNPSEIDRVYRKAKIGKAMNETMKRKLIIEHGAS